MTRGGFKAFQTSEKYILGLKQVNLGSKKRPIPVSYLLNWVIWGLFSLGNLFDEPFFWSTSWEMWKEGDLKHFKPQKNIFFGSRKSIWGPKRPISESYEINLAIWVFFQARELTWYHFSSLCHEKCGQRQIWGFLNCRKIYFGALQSPNGPI